MKNILSIAFLCLFIASCAQKNKNTVSNSHTKLNDKLVSTTDEIKTNLGDTLKVEERTDEMVDNEKEKVDLPTSGEGTTKKIFDENGEKSNSELSKGSGKLETPNIPVKGKQRIVMCVVDEKNTYYAVTDCFQCPDAMQTYYDGEMNRVCTSGGITGRSTCEEAFLKLMANKDKECTDLKTLPTKKVSNF